MFGSLLSSLIFSMALIIIFYIMYKNNYLNYYSVIIYLFIMFTWIVPLIFYDNKEQFGIVTVNSTTWIAIGVTYFIIQVFVRYFFAWLSNLWKSKKKVFMSLLIGYSLFSFLAIFIHNVGIFYVLVICSSILSATYGLSANYWVENTGNTKAYQANLQIYILPLIGMITAKLLLPSFNFTTNLSWSLLFSVLSSITFLVGVMLYFIPEKKDVQCSDLHMSKEKIFKEFNWKTFIAYPMLIGISSFIYMMIITFDLFKYDNSINDNLLPVITTIIGFISFITAIFAGNYLIKKFGYITLTIAGISITVVGIVWIFVMVVFKNYSWQLLLVAFLLFIIGMTILQILTLGDIVHIELKSTGYFLTTCLAILSLSQAAGFLFSSLLEISNLTPFTSFSIIIGMIALLLAVYLLILWWHKELLTLLRSKFVVYEYTEKLPKAK